jgi:hypothetical protein
MQILCMRRVHIHYVNPTLYSITVLYCNYFVHLRAYILNIDTRVVLKLTEGDMIRTGIVDTL